MQDNTNNECNVDVFKYMLRLINVRDLPYDKEFVVPNIIVRIT